MKLDKKLLAGGAGAIEMKAQTKHAIRKDKVSDKKGKMALAGVKIDYESDVPVQDQIRDALTKNSVRVIDLFKSWDEDGDGTVRQYGVPTHTQTLTLSSNPNLNPYPEPPSHPRPGHQEGVPQGAACARPRGAEE